MIVKSLQHIVKKEPAEFKPQMTSLVDVMTILLVFLIKSFSAEGTIVTPSSDLKLPVSRSEIPAQQTNSIQITKKAVMVNGTAILDASSITGSDSLLVPELFNWLQSPSTRGSEAGKEMMIQADRHIPFDIIKKVMYTCSKAGRSDFTILVLNER